MLIFDSFINRVVDKNEKRSIDKSSPRLTTLYHDFNQGFNLRKNLTNLYKAENLNIA